MPGPDGEDQREAGKLLDLSHHLATAREIPCQTGPGTAGALSPSSFKYTRGDYLKNNFHFFQKGYLATGVTFFTVPVLIISYL